ncbi:hypothetical protein TVAG_036240 [Trichomonas vaginalis G3]|uniref:Uncharacterized protein n=1 Tax=Trichomonas vaginalis (strain ATCC PRA-98 / G3) TaxID=412133 RepID=A2DAU6_TRIV3|nr:hypothetical protein TVAGG3_0812760 [Trichomonas vaginalis G3]EAY22599.1 hypothetical protein TVAG_036240 [Trichomonas vaginalis G3]KAI5497331.1 hypothetical protein TVAGG3_0812760 [Trichomonas vaginalis G3]|eukprot:XP_001583585.1 hypothetical protein [Trichomonas vaginalis G3]
MMVGIFLSPTILFFIVNLFTRSNVVPTTWVHNIIKNAVIGAFTCLFICKEFDPFMLFTFVFINFVLFGFTRCFACCAGPTCKEFNELEEEDYRFRMASREALEIQYAESCCACCTCCTGVHAYDPMKEEPEVGCTRQTLETYWDTGRTIREMKYQLVSSEDMQQIITENIVVPPTPKACAVGFVNGKHIVIQDRQEEPINYATWQESLNEDVKNAKGSKIIYKCTPRYHYDQNMLPEITRARQAAIAKLSEGATKAAYDSFQNGGVTRFVLSDQSSCAFRVLRTIPMKILYELLFFLGYNALLDIIWGYGAVRIYHKTNKRMSMENNYKNPANQRANIDFESISKEDELKGSLV